MAIRDAIKVPKGAKQFAEGIIKFLYGAGSLKEKLEYWRDTIAALPRKQTRVLPGQFLQYLVSLQNQKSTFFLNRMSLALLQKNMALTFGTSQSLRFRLMKVC